MKKLRHCHRMYSPTASAVTKPRCASSMRSERLLPVVFASSYCTPMTSNHVTRRVTSELLIRQRRSAAGGPSHGGVDVERFFGRVERQTTWKRSGCGLCIVTQDASRKAAWRRLPPSCVRQCGRQQMEWMCRRREDYLPANSSR